jgi:hypothetical protein
MAKKPRGGRRKGAGRKPLLPALARLDAGALTHNRIQQAAHDAFVQGVRRHQTTELHDLWRKLNAIPVADRLKWFKATRGTHGEYKAENDASAIGALRFDAELEIGRQRVFLNPGKAAYRVRERVLREVAAEKSKLYDVKISPRMIERCLKEYRKFLKERATGAI